MGEIDAAERDGEEEAQRRGLCIHLRWLRTLLDLCELEAADVVAARSIGGAAEKSGKGLDMPDIVLLCLVAEGRMVMSAIMRRRRSLMGLSLIKGSCPEVGVWNPSILRTGPLPS